MIKDQEKAISLILRLVKDGASFSVRSKEFTDRGGHGNDSILNQGFEYFISIASHPNIKDFILYCVEDMIDVNWNAGSGWEFS